MSPALAGLIDAGTEGEAVSSARGASSRLVGKANGA
jgi:hypothetical protein